MPDLALYPNSFQVCNAYIDEYLHLLSGSETKVLIYTIRRIVGFHKSQDYISLSQFESGITSADGTILDHGTGLGRQTIINSLAELTKYGLIVEISGITKLGKCYALQLDQSKVNLVGLEKRSQEQLEASRKRTNTATSFRQQKQLGKNTPTSTSNVPPTSTSNVPPTSTSNVPPTSTSNVPLLVRPTYTQNSVETQEEKRETRTHEGFTPTLIHTPEGLTSATPEHLVKPAILNQPSSLHGTIPTPFIVSPELQTAILEQVGASYAIDKKWITYQANKFWGVYKASGRTFLDWDAKFLTWCLDKAVEDWEKGRIKAATATSSSASSNSQDPSKPKRYSSMDEIRRMRSEGYAYDPSWRNPVTSSKEKA